MQLTKAQRKYLRRLANPLKPTVMLGRQGLTEQLLSKISQELDAHELIKLRLLEHKEQKEQLAQTVVDETGAALVGIIGNVVTLYRPNPGLEESAIHLPRGEEAAL
jgi:RNA-binding protein